MIYFVRSGDLVKIGYARAPWIRFQDMQTANPNVIEMLAIMPGGFFEEKTLHKSLAYCRYRGEWFCINDEILQIAADIKEQYPDLNGSYVEFKTTNGLERLTHEQAASLIIDAVSTVRDAGHDVIVRHALISGNRGILVFMPGFELIDGNLRLVASEAAEPLAAEAPA